MLKKLRIALATICFILITLLFVGIGAEWWGWLAKLQFLPAALALNVAVLAGIILVTVLIGRIYCSVICPMGVFQDLVLWIRKKIKRKKFKFNAERKWLRYSILAVYIVLLILGIQIIVSLIAPYSAYGRMVASITSAAHHGSAALLPCIIAAVTFIVISACAWTSGRSWCNNICPVGTILGTVSRFSLFKMRVDEDKCIKCGRCAVGCKSSCINVKKGQIDSSRCVDCFDCIDNCGEGAISLCLKKKSSEGVKDGGRRKFLKETAVVAGAVAISELESKAQLQGGLADVVDKQDPERKAPLTPPGSKSPKNFYSHCTGCQLCISSCPNEVLRLSKDLKHFLLPEMSYTKGYCRPECNTCSTVCPSGAILPLKKFEKLTISIGTAHINHKECLQCHGVSCMNCVRHCPVGAVRIVTSKNGKVQIPVVDEQKCIGCGACEFLCPVRPVSAITVNGLEKHQNNG